MQGKKILIIDDDAQLRRLMDAPLTHSGADVTVARNGKEGLRRFYEQQPV